MTLQQEGQILAGLIWLAILLGPPLALAILAPMFYVDGATQAPNSMPVKADNRATLLVLFISFCVWVLLLKFLYLPAIGFDAAFLSINGFSQANFSDLNTLKTLWTMTLDWIARNPVSAIALLAFIPLLGAAVLLVARAQGRAASTPATPQTRWR